MTINGIYILTIQFKQPHRKIYFLDTGPIENHLKMPQASKDHHPDMVAP